MADHREHSHQHVAERVCCAFLEAEQPSDEDLSKLRTVLAVFADDLLVETPDAVVDSSVRLMQAATISGEIASCRGAWRFLTETVRRHTNPGRAIAVESRFDPMLKALLHVGRLRAAVERAYAAEERAAAKIAMEAVRLAETNSFSPGLTAQLTRTNISEVEHSLEVFREFMDPDWLDANPVEND